MASNATTFGQAVLRHQGIWLKRPEMCLQRVVPLVHMGRRLPALPQEERPLHETHYKAAELNRVKSLS